MTNYEKYKTAKERAEAFWKWWGYKPKEKWELKYAYEWLDLEAEGEKLLPCPFCGGTNINVTLVEDMSDGYMSSPHIVCSKCGALMHLDWEPTVNFDDRVSDEQRIKLISMWNRRAK